jgi:hypothetical protein
MGYVAGYLKRRLRRTEVGNTTVSTVSLGDMMKDTWETLVFGERHPMDQYMERYHSEEEAIKGHSRIVNMVRSRRTAPKRKFLEDE